MDSTITLTDLRTDLPSVVKDVEENLKRFVVTVSGKPKAIIMSMDEVESLEETAEVIASIDMKAYKKSLAEAKAGLGIPLDEL